DKLGRKRPYLVVAGLCVVLPFVYFPIMETGKSWLVLIAVLLGYATAAYGAVGIQMSYFPELFGSRYRYAGMTLAREVSTAIGGGIAPFVCTALLAKFHIWIPLAIYMAVAGIIAFASACTVPETANRDLTLLDDAKPGEAQLPRKSSAQVLAAEALGSDALVAETTEASESAVPVKVIGIDGSVVVNDDQTTLTV
ncbi:MFS transporter, partial [Propionibacterium sp.]|uniref:MFS transporter n=1 Tax=Propionibacterium sp. TaxID=1977903 RepID=UPI0039E7712C